MFLTPRRVAAGAALVAVGLARRQALIGVIRCYQRWIQPESGCIFDPVCSDYYIDAIRKLGAYEGFIQGSERLARCTTSTLEAHRVTAAHRSCPADGCSIPDRVEAERPGALLVGPGR